MTTKSMTKFEPNWVIMLLIVVGAYFLLKNLGSPAKAAFSNEESWKWVDYKGRERQIVVHRNVEQH